MKHIKTGRDCRLVPLRIPTGWAVKWNTLFDEPPLNEDGTPNKFHNDSPDQLLIKQLYSRHSGILSTLDEDQIAIDAGWKYLPLTSDVKDRANGCYKLTAYRGTWEHILRQHYCANLQELVATVEAWLLEAMEHDTLN